MKAKLPIIFSKRYDMGLYGLEQFHPFDAAKYGKVFNGLVRAGLLDGNNHYVPEKVSDEVLLKVHTPDYLRSLRESAKVAAIAELQLLRSVPNFMLQRQLLRPMRYATGGTILAGELAMQHGWAINLSGGYHHAKSELSSGFCFFADINLAAISLWSAHPALKVMVLDLDAHQGNGFEDLFGNDQRVTIMDVYNGDIYPMDHQARKYIHHDFPIRSGTNTEPYLGLVRRELPRVLDAAQPDILIYNAGTDIYEEDQLGALKVSADGIVERDLFVFQQAFERQLPIMMVLSGGYTRASAGIITRSILELEARLGLSGRIA